jgi:hypothetical protein
MLLSRYMSGTRVQAVYAKRALIASFVAICLFISAESARADVLWLFGQTGGHVVGTLSGSLDLTGASPSGGGALVGAAIFPSGGTITNSFGSLDNYRGFGPASFGSGTNTFAASVMGSVFGFDGDLSQTDIFLPSGYMSGSALSGTITFANATFASLGITAGDYVYSLLNDAGVPVDTITVRFVPPSEVPLPGALSFFATGLIGLGLLGWRRKRKQAAA